MKRRGYSLLLALLLLLSLTGCNEIQGTASASATIYYGASSQPADPPETGDSGQPEAALPDGSQNAPDENQAPSNEYPYGNDAEDNRPDGKSGEDNSAVSEDGWYTSKEEVALYIHLYERLPDNYVTKDQAEQAGWSGGNVERYTGEGTAIGGSRFGNREGLLPKEQGRTYTECDIDTVGENSRGAKRIVFSNDGLVYYTDDHYESFELLYGEP